VAEHVVDGNSGAGTIGRNPFETFDPSKPQNEIVGYVLGKVEEAAVISSPHSSLSRSQVDNSDDFLGGYLLQRGKTEMLGHVTSLAVLPQFRRKGLAAQLMKQLHYHMEEVYHANGVGLHVRVSNAAARRLYCEGMGYGVVDVIRGYYQDGEDAFFMRKNLKSQGDDVKNREVEKETSAISGRFGLRRKKRNDAGESVTHVWESGPLEYRLPRNIPLEPQITDNKKPIDQNDKRIHAGRNTGTIEKKSVDDQTQDQVMTGSF
jgi:ribosomal protein S18 acetylase RimI-like enzyme